MSLIVVPLLTRVHRFTPISKSDLSVSFFGHPLLTPQGSLSAITLFLQFAGTLARVFTTLQEVQDRVILASFVISGILNGILVAQFLLFRSRSPPKSLKKSPKKPKKE